MHERRVNAQQSHIQHVQAFKGGLGPLVGSKGVSVYVLPPSEVDFEFVYTAAHTAPNQTIPFILPPPEVDFEFMYMAAHRRLTKQYRSPCANFSFTWLK